MSRGGRGGGRGAPGGRGGGRGAARGGRGGRGGGRGGKAGGAGMLHRSCVTRDVELIALKRLQAPAQKW